MNGSFFKDILEQEIHSVFLNPAEFAARMPVDGLETVGILDENVKPASAFYAAEVETWGLHQREASLSVPSTGEGAVPRPSPRQEMDVDGEVWTVRNVAEQHGLLVISLFMNEG